jgi:putative ABC transport system permease protein
MRFLPLVWRNLLRRKARTTFTLASIVVTFVLFGALMAIRTAFALGVELAGNDRLTTIHKVSLIQPLPESYGARMAAIPGVVEVTHATWFGGVYQSPQNFFAQMAVEPEDWLRMYPEYVLPEEQKEAWLADRAGAIVGRATARRFGWQVGDRIPIQGTIFRRPDGGAWEFNLRGIYEGAEKGVDDTIFFFQRELLAEGLGPTRLGWVGWYVVRIDDPDMAPEIAQEIDARFANSPAETKTATEKAFMQAFANQIGDIGAIMIAILAAVFFTILLVAGNTMAQSIRERTGELAVLKTLGFSDSRVLGLVLVESSVLAGAGGLVGLALAWALISQGDPTNGMLPAFYLPARAVVLGVVLIATLGLLTGALPAIQAMRLRIVDALRRS